MQHIGLYEQLINEELFHWQSQNVSRPDHGRGQEYIQHQAPAQCHVGFHVTGGSQAGSWLRVRCPTDPERNILCIVSMF